MVLALHIVECGKGWMNGGSEIETQLKGISLPDYHFSMHEKGFILLP